MPALPQKPERLAELRARFPQAFTPPYRCVDESQVKSDPNRPGQQRRCVFDTRDGIRLIVSHDIAGPDECHVLSVSASLYMTAPDSVTMVEELQSAGAPNRAFTRFCEIAAVRFEALSGYPLKDVEVAHVSDGMVPHWRVPWSEFEAVFSRFTPPRRSGC